MAASYETILIDMKMQSHRQIQGTVGHSELDDKMLPSPYEYLPFER